MDPKTFRRELFALIDQLSDAGDLQAIGRLRETLSDAFDRLSAKAAQQFRIGDHVRWDHHGKNYSGIVEKVNPKTLQLQVTEPAGEKGKRWKVSPGLITGRAVSEAGRPLPEAESKGADTTAEARDVIPQQTSLDAGATRTRDHLVRALRDLIPTSGSRGEGNFADSEPAWEELVALVADGRDKLATKLAQVGDPGLARLASIVRDHRSPEFVLSSWLDLTPSDLAPGKRTPC